MLELEARYTTFEEVLNHPPSQSVISKRLVCSFQGCVLKNTSPVPKAAREREGPSRLLHNPITEAHKCKQGELKEMKTKMKMIAV